MCHSASSSFFAQHIIYSDLFCLRSLFYIQDGAILVFLPGWDNISTLHDLLMSQVMFKSGKTKIWHGNSSNSVSGKLFIFACDCWRCTGLIFFFFSLSLLSKWLQCVQHFLPFSAIFRLLMTTHFTQRRSEPSEKESWTCICSSLSFLVAMITSIQN